MGLDSKVGDLPVRQGHCQIIMATHSSMLMAYPGAQLLRLSNYGLEPVTVEQTDHYKVLREFCDDPAGFVGAAIAE
jgi:predicted ATPase